MIDRIINAATTPWAALGSLAALADRLDQLERPVADYAKRVEGELEGILGLLAPMESQLDDLRDSAQALEGQLKQTRDVVAPLDERIAGLEEKAALLEGSIEHILDRVPGLSAEDARDRAGISG